MSKRKLCDWGRKRIELKREKLIKVVREPRFICKKCARVASDKAYLCRPSAIE